MERESQQHWQEETGESMQAVAANLLINTKKRQLQQMQNYVWGLSAIFVLFVVSFGSAYSRVGSSGKYGGTPFKSISDAESLFKSLREEPNVKLAETKVNKPEVEVKSASNTAAVTENNSAVVREVKPVNLTEPKQAIIEVQQPMPLSQKVYEQIDQNWRTNPSFDRSLIYEVTVNVYGDIVDYNPINQVARDYVQEIPLYKLLKSGLGSDRGSEIAKFTVLFSPNGKLEVNP